jgi:hypothetical protein
MSAVKLSILIPSTFDRQSMLDNLILGLNKQIELLGVESSVEVVTEIDNYEISIGNKRQLLLNRANGEWICFCDSDDEVSYDYVSEILKATHLEPDVITFNGFMSTNGERRENFKIAQGLPYIAIKDGFGNTEYLRHPNHLTATKRSIALQIGFKDLKFAEDYDYSVRLKDSGLIKTSAYIQKDLYHYKFCTK